MSYQAIVAHDEQTMDFVQTFPTLEEAIEAANGYRSMMGYPTYRCVVDNENGHETWSSRTPDARWQALRERVTAEAQRRHHEPTLNRMMHDWNMTAAITLEEVMQWMAEIEAADGKVP